MQRAIHLDSSSFAFDNESVASTSSPSIPRRNIPLLLTELSLIDSGRTLHSCTGQAVKHDYHVSDIKFCIEALSALPHEVLSSFQQNSALLIPCDPLLVHRTRPMLHYQSSRSQGIFPLKGVERLAPFLDQIHCPCLCILKS